MQYVVNMWAQRDNNNIYPCWHKGENSNVSLAFSSSDLKFTMGVYSLGNCLDEDLANALDERVAASLTSVFKKANTDWHVPRIVPGNGVYTTDNPLSD